MERVVLVDDDGNRIATAAKAGVHHRSTPLHLAFSAYVFNPKGELLLTRRAATKKTWPNVWTNSCCGHPMPDEWLPRAVARRLRDELGLTATAIDLVLPRFRYRAQMPNGIVENEVCPVYRVLADGAPTLEPSEVSVARWVPWETFVGAALNGEFAVSPWCRLQVAELSGLAGVPSRWRIAGSDELPPAARGRRVPRTAAT